MKISCPACNAKYRIPDERVRGKNRVFRINCKKCGSEIRVRGIATQQDVGRATMPFNLELPDTAPAAPQRVWFAGIDGKQVGPLTEQEVLDHITGGRLSPDDLVWRKGFGAWTPVGEISQFQAKVREVSAAPAPAVAPRSPRRSQTLELSAAMIELLVKLDAQQGADEADAAGEGGEVSPPSLPPLGATTQPAAAEPAAAEPAVAKQPATAKPVAAKPAKSKTPDADASPPQIPTAAATAAASDDAPPPVPVTSAVTAAAAVAPPATSAKTSQPAAQTGRGKKRGRERNKGRHTGGTAKVSLPGQVAPKMDDASEAETQITSIVQPETAAATQGAAVAAGASTSTRTKGSASAVDKAGKTARSGKANASAAATTGKKGATKGAGRGAGAVSSVAAGTAATATAKAGKASASKGKVAKSGATKGAKSPEKQEKSGGFGWIIGIVVLAALIGGGVLWSRQHRQTEAKQPAAPKTVAAATPEAPEVGETAKATPTPPTPKPAMAAFDAGRATPNGAALIADAGTTAHEATGDAGQAVEDGGAPYAGAANAGAADTGEKTAATAKADSPEKGSASRATRRADRAQAKRDARNAADKPSSGRNRPTQAKSNNEIRGGAVTKPAPKSQERDEIDIILERGRKAAAKKAAAEARRAQTKPKAAPRPTPVAKAAAKPDPIDELLRREKARKAKAEAAKAKAAAKPAPKKLASVSKLSNKDVNKIANGAKNKVLDCYMDHGDVDGGRVTFRVRIWISSTGAVQNAKVLGKSGAGALGACISSKVKTLRFPPAGGASKHTVRYTVGG